MATAATMAPKSLNLSNIDKVLAEWNKAKGKEDAAKKEIEAYKMKVEAIMASNNLTEVETTNYKVSKNTQSRESLSKKDCPANIWSQYCKSSTFFVLKLTAKTGKRSVRIKAKTKAKGKGRREKTKRHLFLFANGCNRVAI